MTQPSISAEMQNQIQAELQSGERIRWSAQPVSTAASAPGQWFMFIFAIPWTAFAIFWTLMASGMLFREGSSGPPMLFRLVFPLFGLPFILIGIWMLASPWRAKKKLAQMALRTAYVITDRRAIIFDSGFVAYGTIAAMMPRMPGMPRALSGDSLQIESFGPTDLTHITRIQHSDGTGDLIFVEKPFATNTPNPNLTRVRQQTIGFKSITNVQAVEQMLKELANDAPPVMH